MSIPYYKFTFIAFKKTFFNSFAIRIHGVGRLGHGRIGRPPFIELDRTIADDRRLGFHDVNVQYVNAMHLTSSNQHPSDLSETVINLLTRLLDEYMPLGILHIDQLLAAEDILHDLRGHLGENGNVVIDLSNRFYQCIPHNDYVEPLQIINNRRIYRNKIAVLDCLRSALEAINVGVRSEMNPIDYFTRYWLRSELNEVERDVFSQLDLCFEATQHPNDRFFRLAHAFKIESSAGTLFANDMPNQCLLYHFVFPSEILGVLRDGLQVVPHQIFNPNHSLGDGIYFWDCASLALRKFMDEGFREMSPLLLVCRVARGAVHNVDLNADNVLPLPDGMDSFFCRGRQFSNVASETANIADAEMYRGQIDTLYGSVDSENYNMYMVKDSNRVKIEYILQFGRRRGISEDVAMADQ